MADGRWWVDDLVGEAPGLAAEVAERRQKQYMSFLRNEDEDGGYSRFDIPNIAYKYREIWGEGFKADTRFVKDGQASRRVFDPDDLKSIEYLMRLMIVGSINVRENCRFAIMLGFPVHQLEMFVEMYLLQQVPKLEQRNRLQLQLPKLKQRVWLQLQPLLETWIKLPLHHFVHLNNPYAFLLQSPN